MRGGGHGRSDARRATNSTRGRTIQQITRISHDEVLRATNPRITCIKMDIEGAELEIL